MKCIYAIINLKNGKKYIGSTTNYSRRQKQHFYMLKNNKHHFISLQKSFNKNSESDYKFIILENLDKSDDMYIREQYWLDFYKTYESKFGYNMAKLAIGSTVIHNSELSIYQYDLNGEFITVYDNCVKAGIEINCAQQGIRSCCNEKYRYYKGFIWFYKKDVNDDNIKRRINVAINPIVFSKERRKKISEAGKKTSLNKRKLLQFDLNGVFIKEWNSCLDACTELKISSGQLCDYLKGKHKWGKGFHWEYKNIKDEKI